MKRLYLVYNRILSAAMVIMLALMSGFVFLNVVLRFGFNSGIPWTEEFARFCFVWMIFIGAVLALKDKQHLGVDVLVQRFKVVPRKAVLLLRNVLMLYLVVLIFDGSRKLVAMNLDTNTPALNIPYAAIYISGNVLAVGMIIVLLIRTVQDLISPGTQVESSDSRNAEENHL